MRKISANLILPVSSSPMKNGIIFLDDNNRILKLQDTGGNLREESGLEFYNGVIVPGFVLPWLRLDQYAGLLPGSSLKPEASTQSGQHRPSDSDPDSGGLIELSQNQLSDSDPDSSGLIELIRKLDSDLFRQGVSGVGLVLNEGMASDDGFKLMSASPIYYHPILEICPPAGSDQFDAFRRGIELISYAWNEFNLSCSISACASALISTEFFKYMEEYRSSHRNVSPPHESAFPGSYTSPYDIMRSTFPSESLERILPGHTRDAAALIFEEDDLGSIEPGKQPGLNLLSGLDPETQTISEQTRIKRLV